MYGQHPKNRFFHKKIELTIAKIAFTSANSSFNAVFQKVAFTFSINRKKGRINNLKRILEKGNEIPKGLELKLNSP